jgi:hypothetical protein
MAATSQEFDALDGLVITGNLDVGANVTVDTNVLYVDTTNNRVGINKTPTTAFDVNGDVTIDGGTINNLTELTVDNLTLDSQKVESSVLLKLISGSTNAIDLDAGAGQIRLKDSTVEFGRFQQTGGNLVIGAGSSATTALTLQADGDAFFAANVHLVNGDYFHLGANTLRGTNSGVQISANTYHAGHIVHSTSDAGTHINFNSGEIVLSTGGTARLTANSSGVSIPGALLFDSVTSDTPYFETVQSVASRAFNLNNGSAIICTATGGGAVTFTMPSTGTNAFSWTVKFSNSGTLTWPSSVEWAEGVTPPVSSGTDVYSFYTFDGGTTIYGSLAVRNAS